MTRTPFEILRDLQSVLRSIADALPDASLGLLLKAEPNGFAVTIQGPEDVARGATLTEALNEALDMMADE